MAPLITVGEVALFPEEAAAAAGVVAAGAYAADHFANVLKLLSPAIGLLFTQRNETNTGTEAGNAQAQTAQLDADRHMAAQVAWQDLYTEWEGLAVAAAGIAFLRQLVDNDALAAQNVANVLETIERNDVNQLQADIQQLDAAISTDVLALSDNINQVELNATGLADQAQTNSVNFALAGLTQLSDALSSDINQLEANAVALADQAQQDAVDYTSQVGQILAAFTEQTGAAVQANAQAAITSVADTIRPTATDVSNQAIDNLGIAAGGALIGPWLQLLPNLGSITQVLDPASPIVQGVDNVITQPVATTIPNALAQTLTAVDALAAVDAVCTVPMCENLGGLSNLFKDLMGDLFFIGLAVFLAECLKNPSGAADVVQSFAGDVGGIFDGMISLLESI